MVVGKVLLAIMLLNVKVILAADPFQVTQQLCRRLEALVGPLGEFQPLQQTAGQNRAASLEGSSLRKSLYQ